MSIKSVLVGLDLSALDDHLISYSSMICESFDVDHVYFLHVAKNLELPEEIIKEYNEVFTSVDEGIEHQIRKKTESSFKARAEVTISVEEGNAVDRMLRFAKIKNADLIILGRKIKLKGSGVIPNSIVRKSPCDLLLVPEEAPDAIKKILVPVDFSKHSHLAMDNAIELAKYHNAGITCVNVFEVPTGYSKIGKSYSEFAEIMKGNATKDFEKFIAQHDTKVEFDCILSKDHEHGDELIIYIQATKPDMVVIGSKGRTDAAIVLLGSMAEKLTKVVKDVPLLVIKRKGESVNVFEALLRL